MDSSSCSRFVCGRGALGALCCDFGEGFFEDMELRVILGAIGFPLAFDDISEGSYWNHSSLEFYR